MSSELVTEFHEANFSFSSSSGGTSKAIDRHSPRLRDPQREKFFFSPILSRFHSKATSHNKSKRKLPEKSAQLISPATSSRYLLNNAAALEDLLPEEEIVSSVITEEPSRLEYVKEEDITVISSSSPVQTKEEVVVLRVSLHCKGCEVKVRKHISKMQGVRSFSTDLTTKKVTVIGDLSPLSVLNSVSKMACTSPPLLAAPAMLLLILTSAVAHLPDDVARRQNLPLRWFGALPRGQTPPSAPSRRTNKTIEMYGRVSREPDEPISAPNQTNGLPYG